VYDTIANEGLQKSQESVFYFQETRGKQSTVGIPSMANFRTGNGTLGVPGFRDSFS